MKYPGRVSRSLALIGVLLATLAAAASAQEPAPALIDSGTIVRSLTPPAHTAKRGFEIEARPSSDAGSGGAGSGKINLDIRFGNDSVRLTEATQAQLAALGAALSSPHLANSRFLIAGHTSATGSAEHNQKLSEGRARSVRSYLIEHFHIAPERIEATGYGASRPLPDYAPAALQQRRVEIITLPSA
jgi:OmpA-OmpF porin, OOP family